MTNFKSGAMLEPEDTLMLVFNTIGDHTILGWFASKKLNEESFKNITPKDYFKDKSVIVKATEGHRASIVSNMDWLMSVGVSSIDFKVYRIIG